MNVILKRDPVWVESLLSPPACPSLFLLGGDGHQVAVPAQLLLAVSPLVRRIMTDLLPPAYGPCFLSIPSVTEEVLHAVVDILTTGEVVGEHENNIEKVKELFGMLGVGALLVSCHKESIQVGQVLDRDIEAQNYSDGTSDVRLDEENIDNFEVIVKTEDQESTDVEESPKSWGPVKALHNRNDTSEDLIKKGSLLRCVTSVHPCHICPKKFTTSSHLARHIKVIHDQIKVPCHLCPKKFTQKQFLKEHIRIAHECVKLSCHLCPQMFTVKRGLVEYIISVHNLVKFPCSFCSKKYSQERSLSKHIREVHNQI